MTKKKSLAAAAERFYVIEQMTMVEIAQLLNVHEKTNFLCISENKTFGV